MTDVQVITTVIYYSIANDLTYREHPTIQEAKSTNAKILLKMNIGHNPFETNAGQIIKNYAASLELLNFDGSVMDVLEENNWKLKLDHFGLTYGYRYTTMWVYFTDPFDIKKEETFNISVGGFIEAYKRFEKLNRFESHKYSEIAIQLEELKAENQKLKETVDLLTQEKSKLSDRLSTIALAFKEA